MSDSRLMHDTDSSSDEEGAGWVSRGVGDDTLKPVESALPEDIYGAAAFATVVSLGEAMGWTDEELGRCTQAKRYVFVAMIFCANIFLQYFFIKLTWEGAALESRQDLQELNQKLATALSVKQEESDPFLNSQNDIRVAQAFLHEFEEAEWKQLCGGLPTFFPQMFCIILLW